MNKRIALLSLTGVLALASCGQTNVDPTCATGQNLVNGVCTTPATTGSVTFVGAAGYTVVVKDSKGAVVPAANYGTLAPGTYSVTYSKDGYVSQNGSFTITAGQANTVTAPTLVQVGTSTGAVSFTNPNGYTVVVKDANGNVVPAANYATLAPGTYNVTFSKDGYVSQGSSFTITAAQTTTVVAPTLSSVTPATPQAYYVNGAGTVVAITAEDLQNAGSRFVFYTWLED